MSTILNSVNESLYRDTRISTTFTICNKVTVKVALEVNERESNDITVTTITHPRKTMDPPSSSILSPHGTILWLLNPILTAYPHTYFRERSRPMTRTRSSAEEDALEIDTRARSRRRKILDTMIVRINSIRAINEGNIIPQEIIQRDRAITQRDGSMAAKGSVREEVGSRAEESIRADQHRTLRQSLLATYHMYVCQSPTHPTNPAAKTDHIRR